MKIICYGLLSYFLSISIIFAQSVLDEINVPQSESRLFPNLVKERIQRISFSKRVFILTNINNSFSKGDFISLITEEELVARAIVAKQKKGNAGVKILKIYSLDLWKKLNDGDTVSILKGDDSLFKSKSERNEEIEEESTGAVQKLLEEEDLFNKTTLLEDDLSIGENKKRLIKQDNILGLAYGSIQAIGATGSSQRYYQPVGFWAYQIDDNIWGEAVFGQNLVTNFPTDGLDTKLTNITLRLKYTMAAPFHSYLCPYVGLQIIDASSPGAGVRDPDDSTTTDDQLLLEEELVNNSESNSVIFGVTLLKRLVPGWFLRADLGSDIISVGASLEF